MIPVKLVLRRVPCVALNPPACWDLEVILLLVDGSRGTKDTASSRVDLRECYIISDSRPVLLVDVDHLVFLIDDDLIAVFVVFDTIKLTEPDPLSLVGEQIDECLGSSDVPVPDSVHDRLPVFEDHLVDRADFPGSFHKGQVW